MSEIKAAASAYHLFQKDKYAHVKASLEVSPLGQRSSSALYGTLTYCCTALTGTLNY